ncbi:guanylate kinase [Acidiferrobacter sp.]|uniref:guanylate kinase n=1 Tax=Acidiferrobacter sp. TaxID=1872107 RepID=UPI00261EA740|nr:guanylate kinase [Acidiferrobacter sp.]
MNRYKILSSEPRLVILSAPSGAGKSSLAKALATDPRFGISVSHTTRSPRPGEQDGVHYHFVDHATFAHMVADGAFLEHAQVFGNRYGTTRAAVESLLSEGRHVILDIDWQGARRIKALWPEALAIFILPPSLEALEARLRGRGQDDESVIVGRMDKARAEIAHAREFDHIIVNDEFDEALADLKTLIAEGRVRRPLRYDPGLFAPIGA